MTNLPVKIPVTSQSGRPLRGQVELPGDKSISHRSLMLGALAVGRTRIENLLESEDVIRTASAMRQMGATIERGPEGVWSIDGVGVGALSEPVTSLDFGNSGTGVRLVMGIAGTHPFTTTFTGDESLSNRPMARVLDPLKSMGAEIISHHGDRLPLSIKGPETALAQTFRIPVPSAQVKSAVLLAGLNAPGTTTVIEPIQTRDHTERMLAGFGAKIDVSTDESGARVIALNGHQELSAQNIVVPGDPSSAAFLMVAALIIPDSEIRIKSMLYNSHRTGLLKTLLEMGGNIEIENERTINGERIVDVQVRSSDLIGVVVPPERAPSMIDEYPILAVAAAFASGATRFDGLGELRVKESDRLAAIENGLKVNNVPCVSKGDSLSISGGANRIGGGTVKTHFDHRIAMSFLIMGLASHEPVTIDDSKSIPTSFPGFVKLLESTGADFLVHKEELP